MRRTFPCRALACSALSCCAAAALLSGCGGSSSTSTSSPTTYSVGGSVAGLNGTLVLQDNGADNLTITNNGYFAFVTSLAPGSAYSVTILTQPTNQTCSLTGATGTLSTSVTSVSVTCVSTGTFTEQWTWQNGADAVGAAGVYGTQGTAAAGNSPGARRQPSAWTDASGNLWLFGGYGTGAAGSSVGLLNDVWEYQFSSSGNYWAWEAGSDSPGAAASYGTSGTPAAGNTPGAREGAASWSDGQNLWLFGGDGLSSSATVQFNDLWEFQPASEQWVWVASSSTAGNAGSYGTLGVAAGTNLPPARSDATTWVDGSGVFWLFGGVQLNASGGIAAVFNDLWTYDTTTKVWTWVGGSSTPDATGVYGTQGAAAATNAPGARLGASAWVDANGNFWLFGGEGLSASGVSQQYDDLWEYTPGAHPGTGEWAWVGGAATADAPGIYGTQGTGAAGDGPGARASAVSWQDSAGNLWLFGGYGYDQGGVVSALNDLWEYAPASGLWTWIGGSSTGSAAGNYGALGTSTPSNIPGARQQAVGWRDGSGNFWLFGGYGFDAFGAQQDLNDLWSYTPNP